MEEALEGERGSFVVEVEIDQHVVRIVNRPMDSVGTYPCSSPCVGESVERACPGLEVGDGVLDVKCDHVGNVRRAVADWYPGNLGF